MTYSHAAGRRAPAATGKPIVLACLWALLALASCVTTPPPRAIDASADGSRITLAPSQVLRVTVEANPATGYRWVVDRGAATVLEPVGQPLYTPTSTSAPLVGGGGTMTFEFVAATPGHDTLQMTYRMLAPGGSAAVRSLRVEVVVQ